MGTDGHRTTLAKIMLSPNISTDDFPSPPTVYDELDLFEDRVSGWMIQPAEYLVTQPHAGFAALLVVTAYFEMIARYMDGDTTDEAAGRAFENGLRSVFPSVDADLPRLLRDQLRNQLYHRGITGADIVLSGELDEAIQVIRDEPPPRVGINPRLLLQAIRRHFRDYIDSMRTASQSDRRDNFRTVFEKSRRDAIAKQQLF